MVLVATLAECRPVTHYWQVIPDPGPQCRQGYAQLLTMGITDIVTDVLLITFPIPIIVRSSMPLKRKVSLVALFSLSLGLIIVTGARMPLVIDKKGLQQFRTMFASSEILAAAIVSNAIVLGSFLRDRGVKKSKFKAPSTTDSAERRSSRRFTDQPRSSDEDLARSLGYRTKPELLEKSDSLPRPAPVADLDLLPPTRQSGPFANNNWRFPDEDASTTRTEDHSHVAPEDVRDPMPSPRGGRRVSWFDAGGLLLEQPGVTPSPTDSVIAHDFAAQPRRGSRASNSIMSAGRACLPARRNSRLSQRSDDVELGSRPTQPLQDLGGLLSEDREQEEAQSTVSSNPSSSVIPPRHASMQRTSTRSTQTSYDVPPLQDAGGLLSSAPSAATIRRTTTH